MTSPLGALAVARVVRVARVAFVAFVAFVALAVAAPRDAVAQSAEAESLFREGEKLMKDGALADACDAFEASNRIEPRAGTLIRLGECREKNGELASAWSAYTDALNRVRDPRKKEVATRAAAALEARLSYLTISVPDEARITGLVITRNGAPLDEGLWNRAVPVNGGDYVIGGQAPGHEEWTTTVSVPVEGGRVSIDVPRFKAISELIEPPPRDDDNVPPDDDDDDGAGDDDDDVRPGDVTPPGIFTGRRKVAIAVGAVGLVALAVGGALGSQVAGLNDDALALCPDPASPCADAEEAQALNDRARSRALFANVGFGVGAAAVIGAAVLWFTGAPPAAPSPSATRTAIAPRLQPGFAGIDVAVRF